MQLLRYCVGLDISKDCLQVCLSVIDTQGLARMGLEQQLTLWKPLSENIYSLRLLTRQHQRFQEWKTQCRNQQHALDYSAVGDAFSTKQNAKLLAVYD